MLLNGTNNAQRAALYARVSSDLQSAASIADQLRICAEWAAKQGLLVAGSYTDQGISGASLKRPGIRQLLQDAAAGKFDIILTESLDRLSRDQEDIAHVCKRMRFQGIKMITLAEAEVNELHIGLKGTMGALYLKDLADNTRRGLRGRIEAGKSGGGSIYGYDVVKTINDMASRFAGTAASTRYTPRSSKASSRTTPGASHPGRPPNSSIRKACRAPGAKAGARARSTATGSHSCTGQGGQLMQRRELLRMQVRFPRDVHQWLRAQAERNMSSINAAEIIRCVRDAMDRKVPCTTPPHDRPGAAS